MSIPDTALPTHQFGLDISQFPLDLRSKMQLEAHGQVLVRGRFGPPKSFERAAVKYTTHPGGLKDLNRCTLEVEDPYVMALIFYALHANFVVCGVKNKFNNPPPFEQPPDLHLNLDFDGWLVEVQLLFRDILSVKKELHYL